MTFRYYGQNGDDYLLWHFFDFKKTGFFLDLGAHDGVALSNTKSFEEQGWTGICVEPIPEVFAACRRARRRVIQAACVAGPERQVEINVDRSGLFAGIETDETHARDSYAQWGTGDPGFHRVVVPAIRAAEVLTPSDPPIDFVSVDVEGTEIEVLEGLDLKRNHPRVLVVEALTDQARSDLDTFVAQFGYTRARSVVANHFYVASARDARKIRGITINCTLTAPVIEGLGRAQISTHAWSPPTTRTRLGFVAAKLRQRYRRWRWKV